MKKTVELVLLMMLVTAMMLVASAAMAESGCSHNSISIEHNAEAHWMACDICGEITMEPHGHFVACDNPGVCNFCDIPYDGDITLHYGTYEYDEKMHWFLCELCNEMVTGPEEHYIVCEYFDACWICDAPDTGKGNWKVQHLIVDDPSVQHDADVNGHWEVCACGENRLYMKHYTFQGDTEGICSYCGYEYGSNANPAPDSPASGNATLDNAYGKLAIIDANGKLVDYTGFEKFEGADFYFEHGIIRDDMDGLTLINGTWYNMQQGRFNTADGMVFFEGATFLVRGGVIDETQSGLIEYDGQKFVFSYGQFVSSLYGAWPDPISGRFVYIWAGQFYPITDLVSYDGQIFYFIDGYLATDFVGTVYDFNGTPFNVIYGQVY